MIRYNLFLTLIIGITFPFLTSSCDKESKEPDYVPTPLPTPTPEPNPTPSQSTSNCVYTDNTGQKFVLEKIREEDHDSDDSGDISFLYDDKGFLTTLTCEDEFLVKINYSEGKAVWKEDGKSANISFTLNSAGDIATLSTAENVYNVEYSQGNIVKIYRKGNRDIFDESTFTFKWANGSIETITEKINIHGNHYDTEEYEFINTYPNLLKQFSFGFQTWLPEDFSLFWLAGMMGNAPSQLPVGVYQTDTCGGNNASNMDYYKISYSTDNLGRIYTESDFWEPEIENGDAVTYFYHYRNWN